MNYDYQFISQYITIPKAISDKVESLYGSEKKAVKHCIGLWVTNLILKGTASYSESGRHYSKHRTPYYTKTHFLHARDILFGDKYARPSKRGSKNINYPFGIASRVKRTYRLCQDFPNVTERIDLNALPLLEVNDKPIYDITAITKPSLATLNLSLPHHSTLQLPLPLRHYFDVSEKLNRDYFNKMELDFSKLKLKEHHLEKVGLTRVFNKDGCGRWFQGGGYSYQQIPEKDRTSSLLNGFETTELDYSAMFPNILYTWEKTQAPFDIYEQVIKYLQSNGYPSMNKLIVKKVVLMSINTKDYRSLICAINRDKQDESITNRNRIVNGTPPRPILYDEMKKLNPRVSFVVKDVVSAFRNVHPLLSKYVNSRAANELMFDESEIMTSVLLDLMNKNIPAIPIHDSVLFQKRDANASTVKQVMLDQYKQYTGFTINVK